MDMRRTFRLLLWRQIKSQVEVLKREVTIIVSDVLQLLSRSFTFQIDICKSYKLDFQGILILNVLFNNYHDS